MGMLTVYLTALQISEIADKLLVVADDPDLQDSYAISEEEAKKLADLFRDAAPGNVAFEDRYRDLIEDEIESLMEALYSNWKDCGDEDDGGIYRSMVQALKRIKAATPQDGSPEP